MMNVKSTANSFLRILTLTVILITKSTTYAQTNSTDSLKTLLLTEPETLEKIDHYNTVSSDLIDVGKYDDAVVYANKALSLSNKLNSLNGAYMAQINLGNIYADQGLSEESLIEYRKGLDIAEKKKDPKMQAVCLNNIGLVYHNNGQYDEAMLNFIESLNLRKSIQFEDGVIDSYTNIGNVHTRTGNFPEAMTAYVESLKLSEKLNDREGILDSYINISVVQLSQGKYEDALSYLEQAKTLATSLKDNHSLANVYNNIGFAFYSQGLIPQALVNFKKALEIRKILSDYYGLSVSYNNIGAILEQENEIDSALVYYSLARKTQIQLDDPFAAAGTILNMAIIETRRGNFENATKILNEGLTLAQKHNIKEMVRDFYLQYAMVDSLQGNWAEAFKHSRLYMANKEVLFNETINEQVESLKIQYETEKKEKENKHLKLENENQFHKNQLLAQQNVISSLHLKSEQDQHLISINLTKQQRDSIEYLDQQRQIQEKLSDNERSLRLTEAQLHQNTIKEKNLVMLILLMVVLLTGVIVYLASRVRKRKAQAELKEVEEKALRAQLKPHFVFNALASIQNYVRENPSIAENYLSKFSHFTQEVLVNSEKKRITLTEEIEMLTKYIDLSSLRLKQPIEFKFIIDPGLDTDDIMVPPAILQPLVENCINHNFSRKNAKGLITLQCFKENNLLKCQLTDECNGQASPLEPQASRIKDRKSFGLDIVKERIDLWSKGKAIKGFLELFPQDSGMRVVLGIPT